MKNKTFAVLLAGSMLWCISIVVGPIVHSRAIYSFFSLICHQDSSRSWHLFGEALPVCIRCTSIYFGFLAALCLRVSPRTHWLRAALVLMIFEFVSARLLMDVALVRSVSGVLFGVAAAPFVRQGIQEMTGDFM